MLSALIVISEMVTHWQFWGVRKDRLSLQLTDESFPFAVGLSDLIDAAHLAVGHTPDDEDDDAWAVAYLSWTLVLMPVPITGTENRPQ